jgi:hypothetical protein
MAGRDGADWIDVRIKGQTVGFVIRPSNPGGKWHAYMDHQHKAGSSRIGSYDNKDAAVKAVQRAAFG